MDNKTIILNCPCIINTEKQTLVCRSESSNNTNKIYQLNRCKNLPKEDLIMIAKYNREYLSYLCKIGKMNDINYDGCLPIRCLDMNIDIDNCQNDEEITISPKYLINCFIHLLQLLVTEEERNNNDFNRIFIRDTTIQIPTTHEKIQYMFNHILKQFLDIDLHPEDEKMEMEVDGKIENDNDNDNDFGDLLYLLKMVIGHVAELQQHTSKKLGKCKKNMSIIGGIPQKSILDKDNDAISNMLSESVKVLETFIYEHRILSSQIMI